MEPVRIERDVMGEKEVPADALYGIQTLRAKECFALSSEPMDREIIQGMVKIKWACALANQELGLLPAHKAEAITQACDEVLRGMHDDQFVVDIFQSGSGTNSHMNVNEVLANLAAIKLGGRAGDGQLVHPIVDVNMGQSTNNVFTSAIKVASAEWAHVLQESLRRLEAQLHRKREEFADVVKSGRTHLRDAVPITLGQEFGAYAHALEKANLRIEYARQHLLSLGVGGNAVGTGVNTLPGFRQKIVKNLNRITREKYHVAENGIEITQFITDIGQMSSSAKLLAMDLMKICSDLRLMSSGPHTGLREINLPPHAPGSSIMPGKVNPIVCEAAGMACLQVLGFDAAVSIACGLGQLELNTHLPLVGHNVMKNLRLLESTCRMLADQCVCGITANRDICAQFFETSTGLAAVLNPRLGYERVAELVKESLETDQPLKSLILDKGILDKEHLEVLLTQATGETDLIH
jgi:aspartate ammonia-lyase